MGERNPTVELVLSGL